VDQESQEITSWLHCALFGYYYTYCGMCDSGSASDSEEASETPPKEFIVIKEFPEHLRALPLHDLQPRPNLTPRSGPLKLRSIDLGLYNIPGSDENPIPKKRFPDLEPPPVTPELLTGTVIFRRPYSSEIRGAMSQRLIDPKWIFCQKGPELEYGSSPGRYRSPLRTREFNDTSTRLTSRRESHFLIKGKQIGGSGASGASRAGAKLPGGSTAVGTFDAFTTSTSASSSSSRRSSKSARSTSRLAGIRPSTAPLPRRRGQRPVFNSAFEGGNLACVVRSERDENVFDLILDEDINGCGNTQWYFFSVSGMQPGQSVLFRILNLGKNRSLYEDGQRPLAYCVGKEVKLDTTDTTEHFPPWEPYPVAGWSRVGTEIEYKPSDMYKSELYKLLPGEIREGAEVIRKEENARTRDGAELYTLQWRYTFEGGGMVYFAAAHPYSFTRLLKVLDAIEMNPRRSKYVNRSILCTTVCGNQVDCVTITDNPHAAPMAKSSKRNICITARVHPGETVSSIVCEGILDFLTSENEEADKLRKHFYFKIVPMLNPDGVINGNYRASALGVDLNRRWGWASRDLHPSIWHMKRMLHRMQQEEPIALYIDLHGHSQKLDWFCYGCRTSEMGSQSTLDPLVLPIALRQRSEAFNLNQCSFQVASCKDQTARVTAWRELKVASAYTVEISLAGKSNKETMAMARHFKHQDYWNIGKAICCSMIPQIRISESVKEEPAILEEVEQFLEEVETREYIPDSENEEDNTSDPVFKEEKEKKRRTRRKRRNSSLRPVSVATQIKPSNSAPTLNRAKSTIPPQPQPMVVERPIIQPRLVEKQPRPSSGKEGASLARSRIFDFPSMEDRKKPPTSVSNKTLSFMNAVSGKLHPFSIGAYNWSGKDASIFYPHKISASSQLAGHYTSGTRRRIGNRE